MLRNVRLEILDRLSCLDFSEESDYVCTLVGQNLLLAGRFCEGNTCSPREGFYPGLVRRYVANYFPGYSRLSPEILEQRKERSIRRFTFDLAKTQARS